MPCSYLFLSEVQRAPRGWVREDHGDLLSQRALCLLILSSSSPHRTAMIADALQEIQPCPFSTSQCSVQFSCSVVSDSLRPHGLQHARPPCPSPTPRVHSNWCPLSQWCHPTISSSVIPFSSHLQSFQHQGLFKWVSSSHQVAKVGQALMLVFPRREARRGKGQRNRPLAEPLALYSLAKGLGCF